MVEGNSFYSYWIDNFNPNNMSDNQKEEIVNKTTSLIIQQEKELASLREDLKTKNDQLVSYDGQLGIEIRANEKLRREYKKLAELTDSLREQLEKAKAFKKYVHKRLDDAGVPIDPDSPHKEHGCRIGGRLDFILDENRELVAFLKELLDDHKAGIFWTNFEERTEKLISRLSAKPGKV